MASLEPHEPTIFITRHRPDTDKDVESRELLKVTPLYAATLPDAAGERDGARDRKLKVAISVPYAMQSFIQHMGWHPDTFKMGIDEAIDAMTAEGSKP